MEKKHTIQANYRAQKQTIATQIHRLLALGILNTPAKRKEAQELIHSMQSGLSNMGDSARMLALLDTDPQPPCNPLDEYFNSLDDTRDAPSFFRRSNQP